jgi:predicted outer membrane repeat protein
MARRLGATMLGLLLLVLFGLPRVADAAPIKVGNGTPASCSETAFRNALRDAHERGGAHVEFRCGRSPVTILIIGPLVIPDKTTIDGETRITLQTLPVDNRFLTDLLHIDLGSTVVLKRLTLRLGWQILVNQGDLTVRDSTIAGSVIHNLTNLGTLTVVDSAICCEVSDVFGGGIANYGELVVRRTTFFDSFGGGIYNEGMATIDKSTFSNNHWLGGSGGAIWNVGEMTVTESIFSNNLAASRGGAIYNQGELTVRRSSFSGNVGSHGGAIWNGGDLTVIGAEITQNTGRIDGGAIYTCCGGVTTIKRSAVTGNSPNDIVVVP